MDRFFSCYNRDESLRALQEIDESLLQYPPIVFVSNQINSNNINDYEFTPIVYKGYDPKYDYKNRFLVFYIESRKVSNIIRTWHSKKEFYYKGYTDYTQKLSGVLDVRYVGDGNYFTCWWILVPECIEVLVGLANSQDMTVNLLLDMFTRINVCNLDDSRDGRVQSKWNSVAIDETIKYLKRYENLYTK